jgi:ankyrin repeat protein
MQQQQHNDYKGAQLTKACRARGLKAMGSPVEFREHLERSDALQAAGKQDVSKEARVVLRACHRGSVNDLRDALRDALPGERLALVNCTDEVGFSPLATVCRRRRNWIVAEAIARELLSCKAVATASNLEKITALHFAASRSSCNMVATLLEANCPVEALDDEGDSPLTYCFSRDDEGDEEQLRIVRLLLDRGASVNHRGLGQRTPLLRACMRSSGPVVELLLKRGADITAVERAGATSLMLSSMNRMHGLDLIPMLVAAGAAVDAVTHGRTALEFGFANGNGPIMRTLAALFTPNGQLTDRQIYFESPDPIGCFREGVVFGCRARARMFSAFAEKSWPSATCWAALRLSASEGAIADTWKHIGTCPNAQLWHWAGLELRTTRHPVHRRRTRSPAEGTTLLHVAAGSNNAVAVQELMRVWMNPLLRDREGRLAVEHTSDAAIRAALTKYAVQLPRTEVMRWYGPHVMERARTVLLVAQRWSQTGLRVVPRDVVRLIIMQLRVVESASLEIWSTDHTSSVSDADCWTTLRCGGVSELAQTFKTMALCQDATTWRWVGLELLTTRDEEQATLLHVAALTNNSLAVRELMCIWMNPLLRDRRGLTPDQLATDARLAAELRRYAAQPLRRETMTWYGPFLTTRVRAWLMVLQRWRRDGVRRLPQSVSLLVVHHVRAMEYV